MSETSNPNPNPNPIPLPTSLKHLEPEGRRPVHLCSGEVAALLEHWGFTKNGGEFVRKLVRCQALTAKTFQHQRGWRFETVKVLEYYRKQTG